MTFHVGQKVTMKQPCAGWEGVGGDIDPEFGVVYTVRSMTVTHCVGLRFQEIVNAPRTTKQGFLEKSYVAHRFRPVVERKTDISVFEKMLNPTELEIRLFGLNDAIRKAMPVDGPSKVPVADA